MTTVNCLEDVDFECLCKRLEALFYVGKYTKRYRNGNDLKDKFKSYYPNCDPADIIKILIDFKLIDKVIYGGTTSLYHHEYTLAVKPSELKKWMGGK